MPTIINKMGSAHAEYGNNNQDFAFEFADIACILDGCSEGKHSEVGAILYAKKMQEYLLDCQYHDIPLPTIVEDVFEETMRAIVRYSDSSIANFLSDTRDYMCFTIVVAQELDNYWQVLTWGDGFSIAQTNDDAIEFSGINCSPAPNYLAYSYINDNFLDTNSARRENAPDVRIYQKSCYKAIGIASDGLSYVVGSPYENEFKKLVCQRKEFKIKRFINQLNLRFPGGFFKDDITIVLKNKEEEDAHDNI